ncbi:ASST-domain-containing protein, partial [Vararia minispora EC-137]
IDKDAAGNYLMSGRHTRSIYYISGSTGEILWTLGGKNSSFTGSGTEFWFQHNPRFVGEKNLTAAQVSTMRTRRITLFDNENGILTDPVHNITVSRGLMVEIDLDAHTATVVQTFPSPSAAHITSFAMGDVQLLSEVPALDSMNVVVGFGLELLLAIGANSSISLQGIQTFFAEYAANGTPLRLVQYTGPNSEDASYRVFKNTWVGRPSTDPDVVIQDGMLYVSWNGATEVASWRIEQGNNSTTVAKTGFETAVAIVSTTQMQVSGLAANGTVLGTSRVVTVSS